MDDVVIVAALRTGVGKFGGTIGKIPAAELGAKVISDRTLITSPRPSPKAEWERDKRTEPTPIEVLMEQTNEQRT